MKPETMKALLYTGRMHGSVPHARYAWVLPADPAGALVARLRKVAKHLPIADIVISRNAAADGTFTILVIAERDARLADVELIEDEILTVYEKLHMGFNPLAFSRLRMAAKARGLAPFPTEAVIRVMRRVEAAL